MALIWEAARSRAAKIVGGALLACVAVALAVQVLGPRTGIPFLNGRDSFGSFRDGGDAHANPIKSILDLISGRSPGQRTQAELTKLRQEALARVPHERALGKVVHPRTGGAPPILFTPPEEAATLANPFLPDVPPGVSELSALPSVGVPAFGSPEIIILPAFGPPEIIIPVGGFPGGGIIAPPPPIIETPIAAVPEPGTWISMLIGFAFIGAALRRKHQSKSGAF
jgi:hypothetical protein